MGVHVHAFVISPFFFKGGGHPDSKLVLIEADKYCELLSNLLGI